MIVYVSSNDNNLDWGVKGVDRIIQNVRNIIRTKKYEVPFMRGMGISPDYLDNSISEINQRIVTDIRENINAYESRANIIDVQIVGVKNNEDIEIIVELEV